MSPDALTNLGDIDIDFNIENIQVNITQNVPNTLYTNINPDVNNQVLVASLNSTNFILDTAATKHIICDKSFFSDFRECNKTVNWGQAKSITIKGIGNVYIKFKNYNKAYMLKDCLYMPELGINLISQSEISNNYFTIFTRDNIYIKNYKGTTITKGNKINGLYYLDIIPNNKERIFTITDAIIKDNSNKSQNKDFKYNSDKVNTVNKIDLHKRLGHISLAYLDKLIENTSGYSNVISNKEINKDILECEICQKSKFTNRINKLSSNKDFDLLEKVTSDLCGPISPNTYDNYKYFITFLDKKSRYLDIKLLRTKNEALNAFIEYKNKEENNPNNKRIRVYATDNGTEFINNKFKTYLINHGISHQLSPTYTPESNGLAERINRTILNKVRALLFNANLPSSFWGEAVITATYLYNRTPHAKINYKTPFEVKYNKKPNITNIRTFGSLCFYKLKNNKVKKLDAKADKAILLGFNENIYKI